MSTSIIKSSSEEIAAVPSAEIPFSQYSTSLADGSSIQSDWIDMTSVDKYQINTFANVGEGMILRIESRSDAAEPILTTDTLIIGPFFLINLIARQSEMRFSLVNNTGGLITQASLEVKLTFGSSDKLSVFPVYVQPSNFSQAALVQSITRGRTPEGLYEAVGVNEAGAILTSDFGTEVQRNLYDGYRLIAKFGKNVETDAGQTEDIWNGGSEYTAFNATANENLSVSSSSANDVGSLVSSGTLTSSVDNIITDSGATFISDGVAVGDALLNDTKGIHGIITSVDSETQITIFEWENGANLTQAEAGDSYRVATISSTGAGVLKVLRVLNSDYELQTNKYVILNGTTPVVVTGDFYRCSRAYSVLAGSSGTNEGQITGTQAVTTSNVFFVMPTTGQTTIAADTIPANKIAIVKNIYASITRSNGSAGSATILLNTRRFGEAWRALRTLAIQTGAAVNLFYEGGIVLSQGTDLKFTITDVSDNDTITTVTAEYYLIDLV